MKIILPFTMLLWATNLTAQSEIFYNLEKGQSAAKGCIETNSGQIAITGWQTTLSKGRQIIFVLLSSEKLKQTDSIKQFGEGFDDQGNALIQTFDGAFVLGGYAGRKNGQSAWLIKTNAEGDILWQWKDADTNINSRFNDLIELADGTLVAVGERGGHAFLAALNPTRPELAAKTATLLTGYSQSQILALSIGKEGRIALTGNMENGGQNSVFIQEIDEQLNPKGPLLRTVADAGEYGADIAYDADGQRYIVAVGTEEEQPESKSRFIYSNKKSLQWFDPQKTQKYKNLATSLTPLPGGQWILAGASNNLGNVNGDFLPYAIKSNLKDFQKGVEVPLKINSDNSHIYGTLLLHDGSILFVGDAKAPGKGPTTRAFAHKVKGEKIPAAAHILEITSHWFTEGNHNEVLDAGELGYVGFFLKKRDSTPFWGIRARVEVSGNAWGVRFVKTIYLGNFPGDTTLTAFSIPIAGETFLATGESIVRVTLLDETGIRIAEPFEQHFITKAAPAPILDIRFITNDSILVPREEDVPVRVCIKNKGEGLARNVQFTVNPPYLVEMLSGSAAILDTLMPGDSIFYDFRLKVSYLYPNEYFTIQVKAQEDYNYYVSTDYNHLTLRIPSFYEVTPPESKVPVKLIGIEKKMRKSGPRASYPLKLEAKEDFVFQFSFVSDPKLDARIRDSIKGLQSDIHITQYKKPEIMLRCWVWNNKGNTFDTTFFKNNAQLISSSNRKKSIESIYAEKGFKDTLFEGKFYIFFKKVYLDTGCNNFTFKLGNTESKKFKVVYKPAKTHIISIGVPYNDIKNTRRNAAVFKNIFDSANKEGRLSTELGISVIDTTMEGCVARNLVDTVTKSLENVMPEDDLIFYISAHSDTSKLKNMIFDILFTDNSDQFTFETHVLSPIVGRNSSRVRLFLDVCNSGLLLSTYRKEKENTREKYKFHQDNISHLIVDPDNSFYIYASSKDDQYSYELDTLSLFTMALIEAFGNENVEDTINSKFFNSSKDKILTNDELVAFLTLRVPMLAIIYKTKSPQEFQTLEKVKKDNTFLIRLPK